MSEKKEDQLIFHLYRKDGGTFILHPFDSPQKLLGALEAKEIHGRYGKEPRVETLTMLKNEFYRMVEIGVQRWVSEMRFTPKFLIAAGAFLVLYFFMSFVVRDPIPVIDEIAVSLGGAIVVYIIMGRRDMRSDMAARKRVALRTAVDRIRFEESRFAGRVEQLLQETEAGDLRQIAESILSPLDPADLSEGEREEARAFVRVFEERFKLKNGRREERVLRRYLESASRGQDPEWIRRWVQARKIDVPLYAVYKMFKKTVAPGSRRG
jgi:hypothetical protein